jgi:lipopolysaccharide export system protein LptC
MKQRPMTEPDIHSRLIGWLKIILPLMALAILSTLFLVARTIDPEDAIRYADVDVSERLAQPRMTDPTYAGVTDDGAALTITADEARPEGDTEGAGTAKGLVGTLETPDGGRTDMVATAGQVDATSRVVTLTGGVDVTSSSGWRVQTQGLRAGMDQTELETTAPVTATGPAGKLSANAMRLSQDAQNPEHYLLVFNGAVKLIYRPPQ